MASKKISVKDDLPMQRVQKQREIIEAMKNENEVIQLDLTREKRDAKKASSTVAATDIMRY